MKRILFGLSLSLSTTLFAQQTIFSYTIDQNDVRALVSNNGTFFHNYANQQAGYAVPKNSAVNAIYFMNIAMSGRDVNNQLKAALSTYDSSDFQPGPIAVNYTDSAYISQFSNSIWTMSRQEIDEHIAMWNQPGYTPSTLIQNWPGNGDLANGVAHQLAPFHDGNSDGFYNPELGDYPIIRGDYAIYCIVNDDKVHLSGVERIGAEMHLMVYQYDDADQAINTTTFVNARIYRCKSLSS